MAEFIYTMTKARKAVGDKLILDDVTMSFFPTAKIGVVGPNGAGKLTILRIMAGLDQPSNGEARLSPGYTVGILLQEPPLNESKTVLGNVEEGAGEIKAKLDRYNAIALEMVSRTPTTRCLATRWPSSRTRSTMPTRGTWTVSLSRPWMRFGARRATLT